MISRCLFKEYKQHTFARSLQVSLLTMAGVRHESHVYHNAVSARFFSVQNLQKIATSFFNFLWVLGFQRLTDDCEKRVLKIIVPKVTKFQKTFKHLRLRVRVAKNAMTYF